MGLSVYFIILMSLAGGLVAMIADKLGRTLGKKRLTLFGMRPRHTATTITVVSGMIIPLFTIGLAAIFSKPVRDWIQEGPKALEQRDALLKENQDLENQKRQTQREIETLKDQEADAQKKILAANAELAKGRKQVAQLTQAMFNYRSQIVALQRNFTSKQIALADAEVKTQQALKQLAGLQRNLASTNAKYASAVTSYNEAVKQRDEANEQVRIASTENDRLTNANAALKAENDKSSADLANTKLQLDELRPQLEGAKLQLDDYKTQLASVMAEMRRTQGIIRNNVSLPFLTHIIFDLGDELARVRVPAGTSQSAARGLLTNLMKEAVRVARAAGAKPSAQGDAATLFPRPDESGHQVSVSQQEETIINGVTNKNEDLVLIAVCELNSYEGTSVPVDVTAFRNPVVYKANDKIAETTINGNAPEEEVVQRLSDFLQKDVRPKALKDGMIPIGGSEASLGELSLADLLKLAHSINDMSRPVRVTAIADGDTRAADPLRLKFRVR